MALACSCRGSGSGTLPVVPPRIAGFACGSPVLPDGSAHALKLPPEGSSNHSEICCPQKNPSRAPTKPQQGAGATNSLATSLHLCTAFRACPSARPRCGRGYRGTMRCRRSRSLLQLLLALLAACTACQCLSDVVQVREAQRAAGGGAFSWVGERSRQPRPPCSLLELPDTVSLPNCTPTSAAMLLLLAPRDMWRRWRRRRSSVHTSRPATVAC